MPVAGLTGHFIFWLDAYCEMDSFWLYGSKRRFV